MPVPHASEPAESRAIDALRDSVRQVDPVDPFAGSAALIRSWLGEPPGREDLIACWLGRSRGNPTSDMRYRWELTHRRGVRLPKYAPPAEEWRAWREAEQTVLEKDPFAFEERLTLPISLASNCELLAGADSSEEAETLLAEALPVMRRDLALCIQGLRPWADTFALWSVARSTAALERLHPVTLALATSYATSASDGAVLGLRFPFRERPLPSATAQLAASLLALGLDLDHAGRMCGNVLASRHPDGAWADADGPPDVVTTLVCAKLAAQVAPALDLEPTREWFRQRQRADGLWYALGPEAPWLTWQIVRWVQQSRQPFALRFEWPFVPTANLDRKTGVPFFAYFADLASLFRTLPNLAKSETELAFFDLIGFRAFNNERGQQRGDEVLKCFARFLTEVPGTRVVRDGGDEFLLVGAPTRRGLAGELRDLQGKWVTRFRQTFGSEVPLVLARTLVCRVLGSELLGARERLGREVTTLKHVACTEDRGPLVDLGSLE